MSETVETILLYTIGAGLLSIVYGFFTGKNILNQSTGNAKMQDIASAIQIGAKAYLARQYKTIAIVGVVVLVIVSIAFSPLVGLGYLVGAALSGIAGYVGMLVSVEANVRTAEASRKGLAQGLICCIQIRCCNWYVGCWFSLIVYCSLLLLFIKI
jgi:K(+)-stimulated pyrophosphate-energized sodium pump